MRIKLGNIEIQKIEDDYFLNERKTGYQLMGLSQTQISEKLISYIDEYRKGKGLLEIADDNYQDLRFIEFLILNCEYHTFSIEQFFAIKELLSELDLSTSYYSNLLLYKLSMINLNAEKISCSYDIEVYQKFESMMKSLVFDKINQTELSTIDYKNIILKCLNYKENEQTISVGVGKNDCEIIYDCVNKKTEILKLTLDQFKNIVNAATQIFEIKLNEKLFLVIDKKYLLNTVIFDYLLTSYNIKNELTDFTLIEIRQHHFYYKLIQNKKIIIKYGLHQKELPIYFDEKIPGVVLENNNIYTKDMDSFKNYFLSKSQENKYFILYFFQKIFNLENIYINEKLKYQKIDSHQHYYQLLDNMIQFIMQDYIYHKIKKPTTHQLKMEKESWQEPDEDEFLDNE